MAPVSSRLALLSLMAAWPGLQAAVPPVPGSCPAGEGVPSSDGTTCVLCGAGTYSSEGSPECTRCPPGTWSSVSGAVAESTCNECPRGTWSSQEGSPTQNSCQSCTPGRWGGAEGLDSNSRCTACSAGTWSAEYGATSSEVCSSCPEGTWSPQEASSARSHCIDCAPGTWSNKTGSSTQQSCQACRAGTWSLAWGATDESTCNECEAGMYQPAVGQANHSVCINCPPGKYGVVAGASSCISCPAGSWNADFGETSCTICQQGQWTNSVGSLREGDCSPCHGSADCLQDASARITIELNGFPYAAFTSTQLADVGSALALDIASACGVEDYSVVDLFGMNTTVTISPDGMVSAFVVDVEGSSANELASQLYSASFRSALVNSTLAVLSGTWPHLSVGAVSVEPEEFTPLVPTETATTSTRSMTMTSTLAVVTATDTSTSTMRSDVGSTTAYSSGASHWSADGFTGLLFLLWAGVAAVRAE